jgi:phosphohistidine phosphatase
MNLIYLLRHAKSSWADPDQDDRERPLAPRGLRGGRIMAGYIQRQGVAPALVLCSPAKRAQQTLELIMPALGSPEVHIEERIYAASADDLLDGLRLLPASVRSVMLIGHNPGLQDLACSLVKRSRSRDMLRARFPTAALVTLTTPVSWRQLRPGAAELLAYADPRRT